MGYYYIVLLFSVLGVTLGSHVNLQSSIDSTISIRTADFIEDLKNYAYGRTSVFALQANTNDYFDKLFEYLGEYLINNGYDPMELPNQEQNFTWWLVHGELAFKNGSLNDIYTIHRGGDSIVTYDNKVFAISVPIQFTTLRFNYNYVAKFMGLGPEGAMDGRIEDIRVYIDFSIDMSDVQIVLKEFDIKDSGDLSLKWTGNGLLDWIANIFTNVTLSFFHNTILAIVDVFLEGFIADILVQINKDLQGILG